MCAVLAATAGCTMVACPRTWGRLRHCLLMVTWTLNCYYYYYYVIFNQFSIHYKVLVLGHYNRKVLGLGVGHFGKSLALALALRPESLALALALRPESLALALALRLESLALALALRLESFVLVNIARTLQGHQ